jgi:hypothetical protein
MAGQRTRFFGWCEPSAYCRKHDGTQLTGPFPVVGSNRSANWARELLIDQPTPTHLRTSARELTRVTVLI